MRIANSNNKWMMMLQRSDELNSRDRNGVASSMATMKKAPKYSDRWISPR